jgi:imidazole glycerol-phosphate synthase subunit HisH
MIKIVDYGLGNIKAFANIYHKLGIPFEIARDSEALETADKIILPGVGAFDAAMQLLDASGMRATLDHLVLEKKIPVIGICVGMQMLANRSDEGKLSGLEWIDADVKKFDVKTLSFKTHLPHMGWNDVESVRTNPLFNGLEGDSRFYFLHSYYFSCHKAEDAIATANYGVPFACAVQSGNIFGVQFHPEKSHHYGVQLLKNFAEL